MEFINPAELLLKLRSWGINWLNDEAPIEPKDSCEFLFYEALRNIGVVNVCYAVVLGWKFLFMGTAEAAFKNRA